MPNKQRINEILSQAKSIRQNTRTSSTQLQDYLYYQHEKLVSNGSSLLPCGLCSSTKTNVSKLFKKAFKKLSQLEKASFYLMNIKNVAELIKNNDDRNPKQQPYQFEVSYKKLMMKGGYKLQKWTVVTVYFFERQKILKISETKEQIDLQFYLLRRSKNDDKLIIVFEPMSQIALHQFRIKFSSLDFVEIQEQVKKLWEQAQREKIRKMLFNDSLRKKTRKAVGSSENEEHPITLRLSKKIKSQEQKGQIMKEIEEKTDRVLTKMQNRNREKIKEELVPEQFLHSLSSLKDFIEYSYGCYFHKDANKVRKIFTFPKQIPKQLLLIIISDIRHTRRRKQNVTHLKVLKSLPYEQTEIYQEINHIAGEDIEFVFFRHYFIKDDCHYYFEKSIDMEEFGLFPFSGVTKAEIDYCLWRVRCIGNELQLLVEADIKYPKNIKKPQHVTSQFLGYFVEYVNQRCIPDNSSNSSLVETEDFSNEYLSRLSDESTEFLTVTGSLNAEEYCEDMMPEEYQFAKKPQEKVEKIKQISKDSSEINFQKNQIQTLGSLLKHRYCNEPFQKNNPIYDVHDSGHPKWGNQWVVNDQGYLVNQNEEKIRIQSSVLKLVIQRLGKNLLSGKSILNMSLPIEIFGTDSNLERLAKAYYYAPKFLEEASRMSNSLERFKKVLCFALGFSLGYIEMEKPFNPLLGQTYQGLIDGCPVYAEQISHHPPISALFMRGRGYTLTGNYQAKVQMGVNSASGINQGFNQITFDDFPGTIKCNGPPGEISGLIYGERKLALVKKSNFIDEENRMYMQVVWGKNKNGRKGLGKYSDYFSGKIMKVKADTDMNNYKKLKACHWQEEIGQIYGRVNDRVFYQQEEIFNINSDHPFKMEDFFPCLESDSRMRKDIQIRRRRQFTQAQEAKQQLQNIQRRDRKLRDQQLHIK